jgi:hypothetical protein
MSTTQISAPVSIGELADKITILELKQKNIADRQKRANIDHELALLTALWDGLKNTDRLLDQVDALREVNGKLWDVEDKLREYETEERFDKAFITAARSVYKLNDRRSEIKKEINLRSGSDVVEEKSYKS